MNTGSVVGCSPSISYRNTNQSLQDQFGVHTLQHGWDVRYFGIIQDLLDCVMMTWCSLLVDIIHIAHVSMYNQHYSERREGLPYHFHLHAASAFVCTWSNGCVNPIGRLLKAVYRLSLLNTWKSCLFSFHHMTSDWEQIWSHPADLT